MNTEFRVHREHLNVFNALGQSQSGQSPEEIAIQLDRVRLRALDAIKSLHDGGGMNDTLLAMVDRYKEAFPQHFPYLDPHMIDVIAATLVYHEQQEQVNRLQVLVQDSEILNAAYQNGCARGLSVRENRAFYASDVSGHTPGQP